MKNQKRSWIIFLLTLLILAGSLETSVAQAPCCSEDPALSYFLFPKASQTYRYLVRYEVFFSNVLNKEKGFFVILPEDYYQNSAAKYPVLFLLHGYNFHRTGIWWKTTSPEKAKRLLCEVKEEEYHWLLHEDIAVIAYAMTDPKNRTYGDLLRSLEMRFQEFSQLGGLDQGDDRPGEIAESIVSHNLRPGKNLSDPFPPLRKMVLILPDGDNGFYTDENEGKRLFPETKNQKSCDDFYPGEAMNYSLLPFLYMKPGAVGKHESYFLELVQYIESQSPYKERLLRKRGLGGFSMGGFGAMKLGLKHSDLFQSVSSQSGLPDIEPLQDKWMMKMVMPEFLEVFGRLESHRLPPASSLDLRHLQANNPLTLIKNRGINQMPDWLYFDYGSKEGFDRITEGNKTLEKLLEEGDHQIPAQPFNGKSGHNYQFWRSRAGMILRHHSDALQRTFLER
ncbi:MAG TPA: alpha/beta hydrolase-fold protein [Thermodesulfobacteriota bacterium]|nr:alpha/beta hydrolase-fold protein [Thermodesulfobacteriota bacterium]